MFKPIVINETDAFYLGVYAFNQQVSKKAHHILEQSWKRLRNSENRFYLKPFIMLTVSYQNYLHDKKSGGDYLFKKALDRLLEIESRLGNLIDINSLILQIKNALVMESSTRRFNGIQIKTMRIS